MRGPFSPRPTAPRRSSCPPASSVTGYSPRCPASTSPATGDAWTAATRYPKAGSTPAPTPPAASAASPSGPSATVNPGGTTPRNPPLLGGLPAPPKPPGLARRDHQLRPERLVGPGREFGPHQLVEAAGIVPQPVCHHRLGEHGPRPDPVDPEPGPGEQLAGLI